MNLALILDVLLIILLVATIVYAMVLHRRLSMLRSEKDGLETFLERMNQATVKADASLKGIRQTAEQAQALLNDPMVKAQALRDELLFLIERADGSAERLAGNSAGKGREEPAVQQTPVRKPARRAAPAPAPEPETGTGEDGARSQAERDLMNALRNVR